MTCKVCREFKPTSKGHGLVCPCGVTQDGVFTSWAELEKENSQ